MFDWTTTSMAEVYTRAAEQKRLAGGAISLIRKENENCRTDEAVECLTEKMEGASSG